MSESDRFKRMSFKKNKVWVEMDDNGRPKVVNGKVRIKYNLEQDYEYQVKPENLAPEEMAVPAKPKSSGSSALKKKNGKKKNLKKLDSLQKYIKIYTDGASSGNPGPSGIGILMIYGGKTREISQFIGNATNNIAELTAIKVALENLKRTDLPVRIFTDSNYSIGLLTLGWKPRENQGLVNEIKSLLERFDNVGFIKVRGHAGIKENEIADYLATSAIKKGRS